MSHGKTHADDSALLFVISLVFNLIPLGLNMIGVTVHLVMGSVILLASLVILCIGFWRFQWRGWRLKPHVKALLIALVAILSVVFGVRQVVNQYSAIA